MIIGFFLAIFLVISVSMITYFSIRKLLDTVEDLSEPNEKLNQLNGLVADVYLLDMSRGDRTSDKDSVLQLALDRIQFRLSWLHQNSEDTTEIESFEKINRNVRELLIGYAGLEEIRYNLTNRNFSQEALKSIETKIQRREQLVDLDFLVRMKERKLFSEPAPSFENSEIFENPSIDNLEEDLIEIEEDEREELLGMVKNIEQLTLADSIQGIQKLHTDSLLIAMKKLVTEIYQDDQHLRNSFINLEANLLEKNKEIFGEIQNLVADMQQNLLVQYRNQNQSAYELTYFVTNILAFLVFLGVVGSLGFVYSILSEVRKANSYRDRLEEAKIQSDNLARAKQDFLANMSHEIRNPLHAIQGFQNALQKTALHPDQKEFVEMIGFASDMLMSIVNDILDYSKLEAGKFHVVLETFDPLKLFLTIKNFFAFKGEDKGLMFEWNIDVPNGKWMVGDQLRINQIMNNLLSNALKFTHQGGITVSINYKELGQLHLRIEDTGKGMTKEVLANVFQEFDQGDTSVTRKYGGTGLGLAIVKKLVDSLGGEIQIVSEQGMGTEVQVNIPIALSQPAFFNEDWNPTAQNHSLQGIRILVVDDDPDLSKMLKMRLESEGYEFMSARDGEEMLKVMKEQKPDVVLLDIMLPGLDGYSALREVRKEESLKDVPVIVLTAKEKKKVGDLFALEDIAFFVEKPFETRDLLLKIRSLL